jgi:flagella basal body P-ring formation protein FlgA
MILAALVLASSGELALKDKARVQGRFVRLADIVDGPAPADVWLGRAPEEGGTRTITADDVRRELELRGYALTLVGTEVVVERGADPRRGVAFEIRRAVMEREGADVSVRLVSLSAEPTGDVKDVRPDGKDFLVTFEDGTTSRATVEIAKLREVAFAVRDIPAGKVVTAGDVELRRAAEGAEDVVGSTSAVRIRAGAAIGEGDLKRKPAVRKGDLVRFTSAGFEVDARATEDGAVGREIGLEIAGSKTKARGRVAGAGRVEAK